MDEKDIVDKMGVYDIVSRSDAAAKGCRVIRTRWSMAKKESYDKPQLRARWVAQEFRCPEGDKHEYCSETPDLAMVKAVIAHAARLVGRGDTVVTVLDGRQMYFFSDLPDYVPAEFRASHVRKLRRALYGTRPASASWMDELRKRVRMMVGTVARCCFRNQSGSIAGAVDGDDIFVPGPREDVLEVEGATQEKGRTLETHYVDTTPHRADFFGCHTHIFTHVCVGSRVSWVSFSVVSLK